jgi:hypothetical protein
MNAREDEWWWLAVNGASCAACWFPLRADLIVKPTPEQLLGFRTREAQLEVQHVFLNAPLDEVAQFQRMHLLPKIERGDIAYIRPPAPEAPTRGQTMWIPGDDLRVAPAHGVPALD